MTAAESVAHAASTLELVVNDLAVVARVRPEVGKLLDDLGVTRHLQSAIELLSGSHRTGIGTASVASYNAHEGHPAAEDACL